MRDRRKRNRFSNLPSFLHIGQNASVIALVFAGISCCFIVARSQKTHAKVNLGNRLCNTKTRSQSQCLPTGQTADFNHCRILLDRGVYGFEGKNQDSYVIRERGVRKK